MRSVRERKVFILLSKRGYGTSHKRGAPRNLPVRLVRFDGQLIKDPISVSAESLSIPRGAMHPKDGRMVVTAIREFVEETNLSLASLQVYHETFDLWWRDGDRLYTYTIFVGLVGTGVVHPRPDHYRNRHYDYAREGGDDPEDGKTIKLVRMKENRFEERRNLLRITLQEYIYFMTHYQIDMYMDTNYIDFFTFIDGIDFFSRMKWSKYILKIN